MTATLRLIVLQEGETRELRGGDGPPSDLEAGPMRFYAWLAAELLEAIAGPRGRSDYAYCKTGLS